MANPTHVIDYEAFDVVEDLSYEEKPLGILAHKIKTLRTRDIAFVRVWWRNQLVEEATWEQEDEMREKYPELFLGTNTFKDDYPF